MSDKAKETVTISGIDFVVISTYTVEQAIADGTLVPFLPTLWSRLSGSKPILATRALNEATTTEQLLTVWFDFVVWYVEVKHTLPEEDQMFTTTVAGDTVWVLEDGAAFTILYPSDY